MIGPATKADVGGAVATPRDSRIYAVVGRTLDFLLSATALLLAAPLMLGVAILIRLDSPGPVLFRHVRQGKRRLGVASERLGAPFVLYKFRSMFADARERFPELYEYDHTQEEMNTLPIKILVSKKCTPDELRAHPELWTGLVDDPRITRVGRWLRRTSLDELPNFINVLKGDMALVGPRPDIIENVRFYQPRHLAKLDVKPGITGLAQVSGRGRLSFEQINEFDIEYVARRSLYLDLWILFKTLGVLLRREGAV